MKRLALMALLAAMAVPPAASAKAKTCGTERARSQGVVFMIRATGMLCATGRDVAGRWYRLQAKAGTAPTVIDSKHRRWRCRVTERSTGTEPGSKIPYTSARCVRRGSVVRFKLRS